MTHGKLVEVTCQCGCGKQFSVRPCDIKHGKGKFLNHDHYARSLVKDKPKTASQIRWKAMHRSIWRENNVNVRELLAL